MSRYVEREAILKLLESKKLIFEESTPVDEVIAEQMSVVVEAIEEAPTADVVEVRHGEWRKSSPYNRFMNCSACGFGQDHTTFNYCPNCGAKMDGERSENGT